MGGGHRIFERHFVTADGGFGDERHRADHFPRIQHTYFGDHNFGGRRGIAGDR